MASSSRRIVIAAVVVVVFVVRLSSPRRGGEKSVNDDIIGDEDVDCAYDDVRRCAMDDEAEAEA